ncbi:6-phosphofructokinase [Heterostelium album PN500]|uniref:6-phosphofructokinase n=1 Tax=Heterostelium pallidum (strain ATCC 26659 / Pp 5 / PN500) TaxID=670386 RepID=D3BFA6_HETP5|nr:6-phosphofructokinase [Heterostelium album PN500]EFA79820.1 6-phosphofructokinase [Heterostelium album PN500]|eukprot:XP_020431941.1 6-phosphofructokinase [Heterostelium album PN500]
MSTLMFGQYIIRASEVFFETKLSMALVNLKPVLPGHVLVCPKRVVKRFYDLSPEEINDIWQSASRISRVIEKHFDGDGMTFAIQDGKNAGQTVEHVHIHIIPRKRTDYENTDQIYTEIEKERQPRTLEEMASEAETLRVYFKDNNDLIENQTKTTTTTTNHQLECINYQMSSSNKTTTTEQQPPPPVCSVEKGDDEGLFKFSFERSPTIKRIALLTSGGDSCGMNPAIRAFVRASLIKGAEVFAIREGYNGLVQDSIIPLNWGSVASIINRGGTIIGTARSAEFRTREGRKKAAFNLIKNKINNLLVIGGDGSLTGANLLREEWFGLLSELVQEKLIDASIPESDLGKLSIVGMVGSIDNDMYGTDITIGADTASHRILECIDSILSTAVSHQRSFVIEVMGRNCGWLALVSGLATGADYIFAPENPPEAGWEDVMLEGLERGRVSGRRCSLIIVAEGAIDSNGNPISSSYVRKVLEEKGGYDARITILGHVQRGGVPTYCDRYIATRMAVEAVNYLFSKTATCEPMMIGMVGNRVVRKPLMACVKETQKIGALLKEKKFKEVVQLRGPLFEEFSDIFGICANLKRMNSPKKNYNIAILHSGGPSPGMNPAVRAFTRLGIDAGFGVYGIFNGFNGLAKGDVREMTWMSVNGWAVMGGAELGTNRSVPNDSNIEAIIANIEKFKINAILMFGGFNGYVGISNLYEYRKKYKQLEKVAMICAPGTIANNVPGTEISVGADTCLNNILDALDKIKQSAVASRRLFVVEVMGAHCGYLCAMSSLTSGAERAYTMEEGVTLKSLTADLKMFSNRFKGDNRIGLIITSENASSTYSTHFIYSLFKEEGKHLFDARESILGHLQQGGNPSALDRLAASRLMNQFVKLIDEECIKKGNAVAGCIGNIEGAIKFTDIEQMKLEINHKYRRPENQWWLPLLELSRRISVSPHDDNGENDPCEVAKEHQDSHNLTVTSPTIYSQSQINSNPQLTL